MTIRMRARKQPFMSLEVVHINCDQCRFAIVTGDTDERVYDALSLPPYD